MPGIEAFFDAATATATYLVWDQSSGRAAVIDAVADFDPASGRLGLASADAVLARAAQLGLTIDWALETHAHADHLSAGNHIRKQTGARIGIGARIVEVQERFRGLFDAPVAETNASVFDRLFADGDTVRLGNIEIVVMHTPGHTPACVTYLIGDAAFVGDTLFMPDYGTARADFPGGDAGALYRSIQRILALPVDTRIFVGHDYLPAGRSAPQWETSVSEQRAHNVHVHIGVSEAEFVVARAARDKTLAAPRLILPSLQVNIRGGAMPAPAQNGHVYLRIPVNAL